MKPPAVQPVKSSHGSNPMRFRMVAMGGTFDVLHKGHRSLLETAFRLGTRVVIGVTANEFARTLHKPHKVDPYELRLQELRRYLKRKGYLRRASIRPLYDPFGPTLTSRSIDAIIVSRRTLPTARRINLARRKRKLRPLAVIPIDLVLAQDLRPISSTRVRRRIITREGKLVKRAASRKSK